MTNIYICVHAKSFQNIYIYIIYNFSNKLYDSFRLNTKLAQWDNIETPWSFYVKGLLTS